MYKLKPVFAVPLEINSACPMYKLKNLIESPAIKTSDKGDHDISKLSDKGVEELLQKQNEVLNTLEQLEQRLSLIDFLNYENSKDILPTKELQLDLAQTLVPKKYQKIPTSEVDSNIDKFTNTDTAIFADPENPPYSLLALPIVWSSVSWNISYHIHSSLVYNVKTLEKIKAFKNVTSKNDKSTVRIFVIWQHIKPSPKVIRSTEETLVGEVSLLRLFNQHLATEKLIAVDQTKSDKILDLIDEISSSTNNRTSELYNLINITSTTLDIENIAIWSALYKKNINNTKIHAWLEQLGKIIISENKN